MGLAGSQVELCHEGGGTISGADSCVGQAGSQVGLCHEGGGTVNGAESCVGQGGSQVGLCRAWRHHEWGWVTCRAGWITG